MQSFLHYIFVNSNRTTGKASLNSEGIFSINQFESNEWIGQGHRENYLHFHSATGALGQFTQNPEFFLHANYPANHAGTELGLFIQKNAEDASSDIPKIAFGGSQEAAFTFRNANNAQDNLFHSFGFYSRFGAARKTGTDIKIFGAEQNGTSEYLSLSRKNSWAEIENFSSDPFNRFLVLQGSDGKVGIGRFGSAASNEGTVSPLASLHIKQKDAKIIIDNTEVLDAGVLSFGNSARSVFTFEGGGNELDMYRDFQFKTTNALAGNNQAARLSLSGPVLNGNTPTVLHLTHDGFQGIVNTPSNNLSLLPDGGGRVYVGFSGQGITGSGYTLNVNGTINAANTVYTAGLQLTSDSTLKTDINKIGDADAILNKISGYTYFYDKSKDAQLPNGKRFGLLAQQVQQVLPEAIDTNTNGKLSVDYTMLIPLLLESNKKLHQELEQLKAQVSKNQTPAGSTTTNVTSSASLTSTRSASKAGLSLVQNIPNPTQGKTTITYSTPIDASAAELTVFSLQGELILKEGNLKAGTHSLILDLSGNPAGVYIYTLAASGYTPQSRSLVLE